MQRINKCVKEKLLDLCDILDIPISNKSTTKKVSLTKNTYFGKWFFEGDFNVKFVCREILQQKYWSF